MQQQTLPASRDLVLVGGGHTHAIVLARWAMNPLPGVRVTLINPGPTAPYSGMLPGHVAGHYDRAALDIDLIRLARAAGARFVPAPAEAIDPQARRIAVAGRPDIVYDVASIDVGITSAMPDLPGFAEHAMPAKPLGPFAASWQRFRAGAGAARVAVIGGGVAGAELALAMAHALRSDGRSAEVSLIDRGRVGSALGPAAMRRLHAALDREGVTRVEEAEPASVTAEGVHLRDGRLIAADFVTGAAGARPHPWLADCPLSDADGAIPVDDRLRSRDGAVFAVGDCAHMTAHPRPKAGVYAVRQAPILLHNLKATLAGTGGLRPYRPQRDYLKLVSLGERSALAERFGITLEGAALWRWKDRIDRRFMAGFALPAPPAPALPWPRAAGSRSAAGPDPLCGGCGSKLGQATLDSVLRSAGDDAAVLTTGGARQVISTDHLRAMVDDPVTMTRIAAIHALGDIWAMGAEPQASTASIVLPRQSEPLAERALAEIMQTAEAVFAAAGARIVGGHSTQGAELTIGFAVTGLCDGAPILQDGARPGDKLILTKPLGTGLIMAAEMRRKADGADVCAAIDSMTLPQAEAARILRLAGATAMTDVTGFGLAGHLRRVALASGTGAVLERAAIPLLPGAAALAARGIRSSLHALNRAALPDVPDDAAHAPLVDPQTGGGLLASVGPGAEDALTALRAAGFEAAIIGSMTDRGTGRRTGRPGQIEIV